MATQDDKISDKRRRLFKALSTVPVVMTLKPGAALANASAYQCLVTAAEDATFKAGPVSESDAKDSAYKYLGPYSYWVIGSGPVGCSLPLTTFIVERDGRYFTETGAEISASGVFEVNGVSGAMSFPNADNACYVAQRQQGYFAIFGYPNSDNTGFTETGVYPVVNTGVQGITGTCMISLVGTGQYTPLSGG